MHVSYLIKYANRLLRLYTFIRHNHTCPSARHTCLSSCIFAFPMFARLSVHLSAHKHERCSFHLNSVSSRAKFSLVIQVRQSSETLALKSVSARQLSGILPAIVPGPARCGRIMSW